MTKKPIKRMVYIDKAYFPESMHPTGITTVFEKWYVKTRTRSEAARLIWLAHGQRLVPLLRDTVGIVSLHVDGDSKNNSAGRMSPIQVFNRRTK